LLPIILKIMLA